MFSRQQTVDVAQTHLLRSGELPEFISRQVVEARRYYFDLSAKSRSGITVVLGGVERLRTDYANSRTTFPYFSIEFVAEGNGELTLAGKDYVLAPGTIFGVFPNTELTIRAHVPDLMMKYYVTFVGNEAKDMLKVLDFVPAGVKYVANVGEIRDIFEQIVRYGLAQSRFSQLLCDSLIPTLAYKIAEQSVEHAIDDDRSRVTYQHLRDLIDNEFLILKNVKEAGEKCGISVSYACRLFQRFSHISPYRYLMRQKMNYAAYLLSHSTLPIKDVADKLGFIDPYHFSRVFKHEFGLSPTEFQRQGAPRG